MLIIVKSIAKFGLIKVLFIKGLTKGYDMNVSNDMSPLLNVQNQQIQEAAEQVKANVANKIDIQSSNLNLVDPAMAEQLMAQNVPMTYSANGGIKNIPTDGMISMKA